jgi:hypothetical protein
MVQENKLSKMELLMIKKKELDQQIKDLEAKENEKAKKLRMQPLKILETERQRSEDF